MRVLPVLAACALLLAGAAIALRPAHADAVSSLAVSGMRIDGTKPIAKVRLTNVTAADVFLLRSYVREVGSGIFLSDPTGGQTDTLLPGRTVEIDLGQRVNAWRVTHGVGPYKGPVQFVAYGEVIGSSPFDGTSIEVEATQVEGLATYEGVEAWQTQVQ